MTAGAVVSTSHDRLCGCRVHFSGAVDRADWKVWVPSASELYCCGLVHVAHGAPSRLHWNVSLVSLP